MKTILRTVTLALTLLIVTGLAAAADAPVYKDGDQWVFRVKSTQAEMNGEFKVVYKDGKFDDDPPALLTAAIFVTVNLNDPEKKWFNFPLATGKKWSVRYRHTSAASGRRDSRNAEIAVMGPAPQPIETPAGKFNAIEIRRTDTFGRTRFDIVYFYSPETKSVIKLLAETTGPGGESRSELELVKYSVQ